MDVVALALVGAHAVVGIVGLVAGGTKVVGRESQVEEFERFGYPGWFRVATGLVEITGAVGLIGGVVWSSRMAVAGGLLLAGVMAGAIGTHVRVRDSASELAVPALLLLTTGLLIAHHYPAGGA